MIRKLNREDVYLELTDSETCKEIAKILEDAGESVYGDDMVKLKEGVLISTLPILCFIKPDNMWYYCSFNIIRQHKITPKKLKDLVSVKEESISFKEITDSITSLLEYKNNKYGDSALNSLDIFSGKTKVGQRVDDKLARIKNSKTLAKNDIADLIGYCIIICKENGWNNFDEFKD